MVRRLKTTPAVVSTARQWNKLVHLCQSKVEKLQRKIYRESHVGNLRKVHLLQRLLTTSFSAKVIAVNRVTTSSGKFTPGIDGKIYISATDKKSLVDDINLKRYKPLPTSRVVISKSNGGKRQLGIPTIRDRAYQALVLLAMEPEWEARFEPNSYGFRPGRGTHNAVRAISDILHSNVCQYGKHDIASKYKANNLWILDADISKCFDNINHKALLKKIHRTSPFYNTINKWLKVGTITKIGFKETTKGTPQGGVISPLLANIALHGLEELFGIYTQKSKNRPPCMRKYVTPSRRIGLNYGTSLIRYADDFVIIVRETSPSRFNNYIIPRINKFLSSIGLELNKAKTNVVNVKKGFKFLGFKFLFRSDYKDTTYYPDRVKIDRALRKLDDYISRKVTINGKYMENFILSINRRIQGIINYFGWSRAYATMSYMGHRIWNIMYKWALKRHPKHGKKWVRRYCFSQRPWETFAYNSAKVTIPYLYWRSMVKARGGWWMIKQVKIAESVYS